MFDFFFFENIKETASNRNFRDKPPKTQFFSLNFTTTAQKRALNASTVTEFVVGPQHDKITKVRLKKQFREDFILEIILLLNLGRQLLVDSIYLG